MDHDTLMNTTTMTPSRTLNKLPTILAMNLTLTPTRADTACS